MIYQLKDLLHPDVVIQESDNIADLWQAIDNQHYMAKASMVIVKDGNVVAGEVSLLDKMVAKGAYSLAAVAAL